MNRFVLRDNQTRNWDPLIIFFLTFYVINRKHKIGCVEKTENEIVNGRDSEDSNFVDSHPRGLIIDDDYKDAYGNSDDEEMPRYRFKPEISHTKNQHQKKSDD